MSKKKPAPKKAKKKPPPRKPAGQRSPQAKPTPGKQGTIPGTATRSKKIPSISKAAEEYVDIRDSRMELGEREVKMRTLLEGLMRKHNLQTYNDPDLGLEVTLEGSFKAKVKRKKED